MGDPISLENTKEFPDFLVQHLLPSWQKVELGCLISLSQDHLTFFILMHGEQNLLETVRKYGMQVFSDREKVAWHRLRFCKNNNVRFSPLIKFVFRRQYPPREIVSTLTPAGVCPSISPGGTAKIRRRIAPKTMSFITVSLTGSGATPAHGDRSQQEQVRSVDDRQGYLQYVVRSPGFQEPAARNLIDFHLERAKAERYPLSRRRW